MLTSSVFKNNCIAKAMHTKYLISKKYFTGVVLMLLLPTSICLRINLYSLFCEFKWWTSYRICVNPPHISLFVSAKSMAKI